MRLVLVPNFDWGVGSVTGTNLLHALIANAMDLHRQCFEVNRVEHPSSHSSPISALSRGPSKDREWERHDEHDSVFPKRSLWA